MTGSHRGFALTLVAGSAALAWMLSATQPPFAPSVFEYGVYRQYQGTLAWIPFPVLRTGSREIPLVSEGKWGAERTIPPGATGAISLRGSRIARGGDEMLEIQPGSITPLPHAAALPDLERQMLGPAVLTGEIADSKCFLGVMNPGAGEVHRGCAIRCLSGGIPPVFVVPDAQGAVRVLWLTGGEGRRLDKSWILRNAGKRIELRGQRVKRGALNCFEVQSGPGQ